MTLDESGKMQECCCISDNEAKTTIDELTKAIRIKIATKYHFDTDYEIDAFLLGMEEQAKDNQAALEKYNKMLIDTLTELIEAKRLLKEAVNDFHWLAKWHDDCELCGSRYDNGDCPVDECRDCDDVYKWRHETEALKLIGEEDENSYRHIC